MPSVFGSTIALLPAPSLAISSSTLSSLVDSFLFYLLPAFSSPISRLRSPLISFLFFIHHFFSSSTSSSSHLLF
ncbi:hypothetical protein BJX66DRAFT_311538 [Aspergillus keveii]|uniref:Uncharacterized protein n=1 Tax=Aspergillus keveii TaxID=714993 RepID=A0ABR4FV80_9EURO